MKHKAGEGKVVVSGERLRQPLVVARQSSKARRPGEAAFDHPATRQEHEAAFGFGVFLTTANSMPCAFAACLGVSPV